MRLSPQFKDIVRRALEKVRTFAPDSAQPHPMFGRN